MKNLILSADWSALFNDTIMPILVSVGIGLVGVMTVLLPILRSILKGSKLFIRSKATFDTVTEKVINTQESIEKFIDETKQVIAEQSQEIKQMREMIKIGFGNNTELVKNGYAKEIIKIAGGKGKNECKEIETENTDTVVD
jgi:hypothetical protein